MTGDCPPPARQPTVIEIKHKKRISQTCLTWISSIQLDFGRRELDLVLPHHRQSFSPETKMCEDLRENSNRTTLGLYVPLGRIRNLYALKPAIGPLDKSRASVKPIQVSGHLQTTRDYEALTTKIFVDTTNSFVVGWRPDRSYGGIR